MLLKLLIQYALKKRLKILPIMLHDSPLSTIYLTYYCILNSS